MSSDYTAIDIEFDPTQQRMTGRTYHKNLYFDVPYISEITPALYQGGCTNGLILPDNIEHVVSLYPWEQYTINHEPKSLLSIYMYDSESEATSIVSSVVAWVLPKIAAGEKTLIHCQAGLNRSSLIAAMVLRASGAYSGQEAIDFLRKKRSSACLCNSTFEKYVREAVI